MVERDKYCGLYFPLKLKKNNENFVFILNMTHVQRPMITDHLNLPALLRPYEQFILRPTLEEGCSIFNGIQ